jgi:hypothetical protein
MVIVEDPISLGPPNCAYAGAIKNARTRSPITPETRNLFPGFILNNLYSCDYFGDPNKNLCNAVMPCVVLSGLRTDATG